MLSFLICEMGDVLSDPWDPGIAPVPSQSLCQITRAVVLRRLCALESSQLQLRCSGLFANIYMRVFLFDWKRRRVVGAISVGRGGRDGIRMEIGTARKHLGPTRPTLCWSERKMWAEGRSSPSWESRRSWAGRIRCPVGIAQKCAGLPLTHTVFLFNLGALILIRSRCSSPE